MWHGDVNHTFTVIHVWLKMSVNTEKQDEENADGCGTVRQFERRKP